ncbi:MAG: hypothetical protein HQL23_00035 [Candidatus Omnitrophica bacterium]|nr:hypothetical protein [Candidatus Omnitrophota bacterium]
MAKSSGKILTVFLTIIAILLVSMMVLCLFFWQKEIEKRKLTEKLLLKSHASELKQEEDGRDLRKQIEVLQSKLKEADDSLNGVREDLDVKIAVNQKLKEESDKLNAELSSMKQNNKSLQDKLDKQIADTEQKVRDLNAQIDQEKSAKREIELKLKETETKARDLEKKLAAAAAPQPVEGVVPAENIVPAATTAKPRVNLDKIIVNPANIPEGRIVSVDKDTEFVIIDLGQKDGVVTGMDFSVYRGKEYLGDIRVTRVQTKMSAADLIPPLSSSQARQNDQVVVKK